MDGGAQPHLGYTTDFLARSTAAYTCFFGMPKLLATAVEQRPTLVLMTCAGNFDAATYRYDQRIVVIATLS